MLATTPPVDQVVGRSIATSAARRRYHDLPLRKTQIINERYELPVGGGPGMQAAGLPTSDNGTVQGKGPRTEDARLFTTLHSTIPDYTSLQRATQKH
jgi:hypothetical protein